MTRPRDRERQATLALLEAVRRARVQLIPRRCREIADGPIRIPTMTATTLSRRRDDSAATTSSVKAAAPVMTIIRAAFSATASLMTTTVHHHHDVTQCKVSSRAWIHRHHRHHYYLHPISGISKRSASTCWSSWRSVTVAATKSALRPRNVQNTTAHRRQYFAKTTSQKLRRCSLPRILVEKAWTLGALVIAK